MYDNFYTLSAPMTDATHNVLNGKVFSIYVDNDGHILFTGIGEIMPCLQSTRIVDTVEEGDNVVITTESGTVYPLVRLTSLIPTQNKQTRSHSYMDPIIGYVKTSHVKDSKPIGGTDIPERIRIVTPRPITRKQLLSFLRRSGHVLISRKEPVDGYYTRISSMSGTEPSMMWSLELELVNEPVENKA